MATIYDAALIGNFEEVKKLCTNCTDYTMAIIGASDGKQREIQQWALENGACFLFSFKTFPEERINLVRYTKNISMLKGPGDVPKGTFLH